MKEGLLEDIRSFGHWRVNIRPQGEPPTDMSLEQCRELVSKSAVSIRGWDYPHFDRSDGEFGGYANMGSHIESWTDWSGIKEFWRMYRSSQFLSYGVIHSDTGVMGEPIPEVPVLNIIDVIYGVSEFVEFAHRLHLKRLYENGVIINISLRNVEKRRLSFGRDRVPFSQPKINGAPNVIVTKTMNSNQLRNHHRDASISMLLELFDHFGWNPDESQIRNDQERFYDRRFSY